ncbi:MAG TPA: hypothetical protein VF498_09410 [Anaerolineales bacterium]
MAEFNVLGVTRHQLLVHPQVPYTSHNSSAAICLEPSGSTDLTVLFERVKKMMVDDFQPGSDPGLCIAAENPPAEIINFGRLAQNYVVTQAEARRLAADHGMILEGLGGSQDGVIGALAAVGLAACGEDGRYLLVGRSRELSGLQSVLSVLNAGIEAVCTLDGQKVQQGMVLSDKLRPARRGGRAVQVVGWVEDHWEPLKLN